MGIGIRIGATLVAVAMVVSVLVAWRDARKEQADLQLELKNTQQALADATERQTSRDAALSTLLAQLKRSKDEVQKPEQVIAALPGVLPLPEPIGLGGGRADSRAASRQPSVPGEKTIGPEEGSQGGGSGAKNAPELSTDFPAADLKPLYDFAVDCKSCQAQLAAAQGDLKDEQTKAQALSRERDDALKAAKGGSIIRRVVRAAKWFAIGAAAGAIAARAAR